MRYKSTPEVAKLLGVSLSRLLKAIHGNKLDLPENGLSGVILWTDADIERTRRFLRHQGQLRPGGSRRIHLIAAQWSRLGVVSKVRPSRQTPDLERLLIDTATYIPDNPPLFVMSVAWLCLYGSLVAKHRLAQMASKLEDANALAVLGLLLDTVGTMCLTHDFDIVTSVCRPAPVPLPLFSMDLAHQGSTQLARLHASRISRRWNLWVRAIKPRVDAVRPFGWIVKKNPSLLEFAGDLRASALACLQDDSPSRVSEVPQPLAEAPFSRSL